VANFLLRSNVTEIALSNGKQKLTFNVTKEKVLGIFELFSGFKVENQ
jgi:hypothetical protein